MKIRITLNNIVYVFAGESNLEAAIVKLIDSPAYDRRQLDEGSNAIMPLTMMADVVYDKGKNKFLKNRACGAEIANSVLEFVNEVNQ